MASILRSALLATTVVVSVASCSSDETPTNDESDVETTFDSGVSDGVDTDVEQPGNLNFDTEQPGLDD